MTIEKRRVNEGVYGIFAGAWGAPEIGLGAFENLVAY